MGGCTYVYTHTIHIHTYIHTMNIYQYIARTHARCFYWYHFAALSLSIVRI